MYLSNNQKILIDGILRICDAQLRLIDAYFSKLERLKISCRQSLQGSIESIHFLFYMQGVPLQLRLMMNVEEREVWRISQQIIYENISGLNTYLSASRGYYNKFKDQARRCIAAQPDGVQKEIDYLHEMVRADTAVMLDDHERGRHKVNASVKLYLSRENQKFADDMVLEDYVYDFDVLEIMLANISKHIGPVQKRFIEIINDPEIEKQTSIKTAEIKKQHPGFDPSIDKVLQVIVNSIYSISDTAAAFSDRIAELCDGLESTDPRLSKATEILNQLLQKKQQAEDIYDVKIHAFVAEVNTIMQEVGVIDLSGRQALDYKRKITVFFISIQTILLQVQQMDADILKLEQEAVEPEVATESQASYFEAKNKTYLPSLMNTTVFAPTLNNNAAQVQEVQAVFPIANNEQQVVPIIDVDAQPVFTVQKIEETEIVDHAAMIATAMEEAKRVKALEKDRKRKEYMQRKASTAELTEESYDSEMESYDQDYNVLFDKAPQQASPLAERVAGLGTKNRELLIEIITAPQNALDNKYKYSQLKKLTIALKGEVLNGKGSHRKFRFSEFLININEPTEEQTKPKSAVAGVPLPTNKGRLDSGYLNGVYVEQFRNALIEIGIKQCLGIQEASTVSAKRPPALRQLS